MNDEVRTAIIAIIDAGRNLIFAPNTIAENKDILRLSKAIGELDTLEKNT